MYKASICSVICSSYQCRWDESWVTLLLGERGWGGGGGGGSLVTDNSHDTEDKQTNNKDNPTEYNKDHYTVHNKDIW